MTTISIDACKKKLEKRFNCNKNKKNVISDISIYLDHSEARIPKKGYIDARTTTKKIEEDIKQVHEEINEVNGKIVSIKKHYLEDYFVVRYSHYKGKINFKKLETEEGNLKLDVKMNLEQIEAIKALVFQNVIKTCEKQVKNFQDVFTEELDQEKVESAANKSFINKLTDKLQLK